MQKVGQVMLNIQCSFVPKSFSLRKLQINTYVCVKIKFKISHRHNNPLRYKHSHSGRLDETMMIVCTNENNRAI